ncbi:hypothetical protein BC833DRAFT_589855 [Globomyces pollinis-pini]|nr:hypothetical protein BC833DRAFT_589855 [Globomyces pollinis-pini]
MPFDSERPKLPWVLLALTWGYFTAPKDSGTVIINSIFKQRGVPWILLFLSWTYFNYSNAIKQFFRPRKVIQYTAKLKRKEIAPVTLPAQIPNVKPQTAAEETIEVVKDKAETQELVKASLKPVNEMTFTEFLDDINAKVKTMTPPNHRFKSTLRAIAIMDKVLPINVWAHQQESKGINISLLNFPGLDLGFVRGDGLISGNWTIQEVLSVINNAHCRKTWDARFDGADTIEFLSFADVLVHSVQKGTFPVSARDIVSFNSLTELSDSSLTFVISSVTDPKAPEEGANGRVRADIMIAGWKLEQKENGVYTTYLVHVDPKGYIPTSLIKTIQFQTPMCIKNIGTYLSETGSVPFVLLGGKYQPTEGISISTRNSTPSTLHLEYTLVGSDKEKYFYIALPGVNYKGVKVSLTVNTGDAGNLEIVDTKDVGPIISSNTKWVLKVSHAANTAEQKLVLKAIPGPEEKVELNGTLLEQKLVLKPDTVPDAKVDVDGSLLK